MTVHVFVRHRPACPKEIQIEAATAKGAIPCDGSAKLGFHRRRNTSWYIVEMPAGRSPKTATTKTLALRTLLLSHLQAGDEVWVFNAATPALSAEDWLTFVNEVIAAGAHLVILDTGMRLSPVEPKADSQSLAIAMAQGVMHATALLKAEAIAMARSGKAKTGHQGGRSPATPEEVAAAMAMYRDSDGPPAAAIGRQFGFSRQWVYNKAKEAGLETSMGAERDKTRQATEKSKTSDRQGEE